MKPSIRMSEASSKLNASVSQRERLASKFSINIEQVHQTESSKTLPGDITRRALIMHDMNKRISPRMVLESKSQLLKPKKISGFTKLPQLPMSKLNKQPGQHHRTSSLAANHLATFSARHSRQTSVIDAEPGKMQASLNDSQHSVGSRNALIIVLKQADEDSSMDKQELMHANQSKPGFAGQLFKDEVLGLPSLDASGDEGSHTNLNPANYSKYNDKDPPHATLLKPKVALSRL
jgi:hypothetical protein